MISTSSTVFGTTFQTILVIFLTRYLEKINTNIIYNDTHTQKLPKRKLFHIDFFFLAQNIRMIICIIC